MSVLLHLLLLVPYVASVNISLTNGELCEGAPAAWTCTIRVSYDGIRLGWRNNGETLYPQLNTISSLGMTSPFYATLTSSGSSTIISIATATLTNTAGGSLLECSDSDFMSPSTNVTLTFKDPEAANLSSLVFYGPGIRVSWSGATCTGSYRLSIYLSVYQVDVRNVTGATYYDFIPATSGEYTFELTSADYLGNDIGNSTNSTSISWKEPKVSVDTNVNNSIANFTIKNDDDERPPITNCSITFDDVLKSCVMNTIVIFNITSGAKHSYNITVTNAAGTVNMNGELSNEVLNTTVQVNTTMELSASIGPLAIAASPTVLGVLIILSVGWIMLRICWKRQCCCPRIWRNSFWLLFFCYDCCTHNAGAVKGKSTAVLNNPTDGGEKGPDANL